ncbi:MAG TPA: class I SAM-dependent methyltransferase [Acidimicrobiales bacterium]|jgi:tRNA (mo5U34)-methyltransferase|nr:class I SAM-dependent methyltransferase [Acidimicrobiales bacterium]
MTEGTNTLADKIASVPWYHTIDLGGGVSTPGEYDHREIVDRVPMPARLDGLRCLDVGTHDGFWAFEMEKRGAAEVVAIDLEDWRELDWPAPRPEIDDGTQEWMIKRQQAFGIAKEALGSNVERKNVSVYDLTPEKVGEFDLAFIGTLLHHLRDPIGALMAIRRVTKGTLVVAGVISVSETVLHPRKPHAELYTIDGPFWALPNLAGLKRQIRAGGWEIEEVGKLFFHPFGSNVPKPKLELSRDKLTSVPRQLLYRKGIPHVGIRASAR